MVEGYLDELAKGEFETTIYFKIKFFIFVCSKKALLRSNKLYEFLLIKYRFICKCCKPTKDSYPFNKKIPSFFIF